MHASRAGEKLRRQGLAASAVCVFLQTNRHRPRPAAVQPAGRAGVDRADRASPPNWWASASASSTAIYRPGYRYVKAGVLCLDLVPDGEKQASLFRPVDPEREEKERRLMAAVDKLNLYGGRGTVRTAMGAVQQEWQMRRDRKSPCYTTRLEDVPTAKL